MAANILILDSNLRLLTSMSERLTYLGYGVATASRIQDAILKAIITPPDIFVCDVMMPELNGWEIKRLTAQIPTLASTPVLFLGSHDALPVEFYDPASGLVDAAKKPITADALAGLIAHLLRRSSARATLLAHPLHGSLPTAGASMVDLLQVLAQRRASGVLRLTAPAWSSEMMWSHGALIDATTDRARGNDAVYAAFAEPFETYTVQMTPLPAVPPRPTVTKTLPDLLTEAVRRTRATDAERSEPLASSPESDEEFLERLAETGVIRRITAAR